MAARWPSGSDSGADARYCVVIRPLLCRHHVCELEIPLYPTHRFLAHDYTMFDSSGMAFSEAGFHAHCNSKVRGFKRHHYQTRAGCYPSFLTDPVALALSRPRIFPTAGLIQYPRMKVCAVIAVDSGPAGGYPTANGSCLHSVASIPANLHSMQKFLSANGLPGVYAAAPRQLSLRP